MDSTLSRQPQIDDPKEIAIITKLQDEVLSTQIAKKTFKKLHSFQQDFFTNAFENLDKPDHIMDEYIKLLEKLNNESSTQIVYGKEELTQLKKINIIIVTNHLGAIKLIPISNKDRTLDVNMDKFEPFPLRHAPLKKITDELGATLVETAVKLPRKLLDIQKACGVITVATLGVGKTETLIQDTQKKFLDSPTAIVMYPEGGTSGKRSEGGPYNLDPFHSGAFVVAQRTGVPIVPICQYFDPESGYKLSILEPFTVTQKDLGNIKDLARDMEQKMQNELDRLQLQNS